MSLSKPNIIQGIKPHSGTIPLPRPNNNNDQTNFTEVLNSCEAILQTGMVPYLKERNEEKDTYLEIETILNRYEWVRKHLKEEDGKVYLELDKPNVFTSSMYYGAIYNGSSNGKQYGVTKLAKAGIDVKKELIEENNKWEIINIRGNFYETMQSLSEEKIKEKIKEIPTRLLKTPLYDYVNFVGVGISPYYKENKNFNQCYFIFEEEIKFLNQIIGEQNYCILQGDVRLKKFKNKEDKILKDNPNKRFTCCLYLDILGNLGIGFFEAICNIGAPDVTICTFCQRYLLSEMFPLFKSASGKDNKPYGMLSDIKARRVATIQTLIGYSFDLLNRLRKPETEKIEEIPTVKRQIKDGHLEEIKEIEDVPKSNGVVIEEP